MTARTRFALAITALAATWLAMMLLGSGPIDQVLLASLYAGDRPLLATCAWWVTQLGDGRTLTIMTAAAAAWLLARGGRRRAFALIAGTALGRVLVELQKYEIARLRPSIEPHLVVVHNASFPSGHSANSMLVYLSAALLLAHGRGSWGAWAAALALSALIGISRIMLGVHYPSDVVGGWAFGLAWTMVVVWLAGERQLAPQAAG